MPHRHRSAPRSATAAREAALDLLDEHWANADGVVNFPVDPVVIAQRLGVEVLAAELSKDVAGLLVRREEGGPLRILLNATDSRKRQRFTCAHELGHVTSRMGSDEPVGFVEYRDELSRQGTDPEERFANRFAAELLMPASAVRALWSDGATTSRMARIFNVSEDAMENRVASLGLAGA